MPISKLKISFLIMLSTCVNIFSSPQIHNVSISSESDFSYELTYDMSGVKITEYKGSSNAVNIPEKIEGMPVKQLASNLFYKTNIETAIIPDSVTHLGDDLFIFCKNLKYVKLPNGITTLPEGIFSGCESLSEFKIPSTVTSIGSRAFHGSGIRSIVIPDTVKITENSYEVLADCNKLESVKLPSNMTVIPSAFFSGSTAIKKIDLPDTVTEIGTKAFDGCTSLEQITMPDKLEKIKSYAFRNIKSLKSFTMPDSVTEIDSGLFAYCDSLETLHLSDSLKIVPAGTYSPCASLKSVNIPKSAEQVCCYSKDRLPKTVTELIIPDSLTKVEFGERYFENVKLPLLMQKRLRDLGYNDKFGN